MMNVDIAVEGFSGGSAILDTHSMMLHLGPNVSVDVRSMLHHAHALDKVTAHKQHECILPLPHTHGQFKGVVMDGARYHATHYSTTLSTHPSASAAAVARALELHKRKRDVRDTSEPQSLGDRVRAAVSHPLALPIDTPRTPSRKAKAPSCAPKTPRYVPCSVKYTSYAPNFTPTYDPNAPGYASNATRYDPCSVKYTPYAPHYTPSLLP